MKNIGFRRVDPTYIKDNLIRMIASDWMLITAGNKEKFNTMTANWGGVGHIWNMPVVFAFVRPERYTYEYTEKSNMFTLTFFDDTYRPALNICGTKSGRDCDKIAEASLSPHFTSLGNPTFKEARLVMECRKLYSEMMSEEAFIDKALYIGHYVKKGGLHKMYIAEIVNVWQKS